MKNWKTFTFTAAVLGLFVSRACPVAAAEAPTAFVSGGLGILEVLHAEAGVFVTPRLTFDVQAASLGVFGFKFGVGGTFAIGPRIGERAPRHALLLGARVMTGPSFDLKSTSGGDDIKSYAVPSVGYGFVADSNLLLRFQAGPVLYFERSDSGKKATVSGPFFLATIGYVF